MVLNYRGAGYKVHKPALYKVQKPAFLFFLSVFGDFYVFTESGPL